MSGDTAMLLFMMLLYFVVLCVVMHIEATRVIEAFGTRAQAHDAKGEQK